MPRIINEQKINCRYNISAALLHIRSAKENVSEKALDWLFKSISALEDLENLDEKYHNACPAETKKPATRRKQKGSC